MTHKDTLNSINYLLEIMQALRAPDGCPWDAQQTPESLTSFILEESCELIDAIEEGSLEHILDELGDLLLQVVFLSQIFSERKKFNFDDVASRIADKLVRRHPHVFEQNKTGKVIAELDKQWHDIKRSETTHRKNCMADHLPTKLPALQRTQKLVSSAYRAERQAELPNTDDDLLRKFIKLDDNTINNLDESTLGQALFLLVKLAHNANIDAEAALRKTTRQVIRHLDRK
jgi:MazG family protein